MKYSLLPLLTLAALCACGGAANSHDDAQTSDSIAACTGATVRDSVAPGPITIAVAGDIMMGTTFPDSVHGRYLPPNGGKDIFRDVAPVLSAADVAAANLEGVLMPLGGKPRPKGNPKTYFIFRMPPEYVENITNAGIDLLSIASNHTNDFLAGGRESTQKVLSEAGVGFAGLKVCPSTVIERAGKKIGFAAFGHADNTCHNWEYDEIKQTVSELDKSCDIVIVSFHGGAEGAAYSHVPFKMETYVGEQRGDVAKFAHTAVDAGADIVYGHGPHVTRALELYGDRLIVYSLGNFCTPTHMGIAGPYGYAPVVTATLDADGRFVDGKIHSFIQQRNLGPRADSTYTVARHIKRLSQEDFPASPLIIADDGSLSKKQ